MQKTIRLNYRVLYLLGVFSCLIISLFLSHHVFAAAKSTSSTSLNPNTFIQSYNTTSSLQNGMVVQLQSGNSSTVIPASQSNIDQTFGVVVNMANASIAIENNNKSSNQVFVANNGQYDVLVSDQNGSISPGDFITVSSVNGIGMKDNSTSPIVIAQALGSFNDNSPIIGTDKITTSSGSENVHIGLISANISIGHNPLLVSTNNGVPKILNQFAKTITGKQVSAWRIWLGLAVLCVAAFITGTMLYGAARSSLISIGRNPLSKKAITRGFVQVVLSALIIFISTIFGVYLLLKA